MTSARPREISSGHWYTQTGEPAHTTIAKGNGLPRATTLADARSRNLFPSVTHILNTTLRKPALEAWKIEQSILVALTTPKLPNEQIDEFVDRVMNIERQQDEEAQIARDLGTDMHTALEAALQGRQIDEELRPWIEPALLHIRERWKTVETEVVVVGSGYAGRVDFIGESDAGQIVVDFKTTKKLPEKGSHPEHKLQLSAYAACVRNGKPIQTANCYISTVDCGKFVLHINPPWQDDYERGFKPLVQYWQWSTGYVPKNEIYHETVRTGA